MSVADSTGGEALELALAEQLMAEQRPAEALTHVELVLAKRPDAGRAAALRERILETIEAMDPLLARLDLTAALHPDRPEAHFQLGHGYLDLDRLADADRCFRRVIELAPSSADAHGALATVRLRQGRPADAERSCRVALELDPGHAVASQTLASILEARGDEKGARGLLDAAYRRQSLFREPTEEPALNLLVLASVGFGNVPYQRIMPPQRYGRLVWYMEYAREADTPSPDQFDLVFNAIGDADFAGASAEAVRRFLDGCRKPVLNRPDQVERTRRDRLPALLGAVPDTLTPRTERLEALELAEVGLPALAGRRGFDGPVLVRPAGSHGGQGLALAEDGAALGRYPLSGSDHYITTFVDYRSADGLYRKYRILFVGGRPFPYHLAVADHWLVHHDTAGMAEAAERRAEEARFLDDPEGAIGARAMAAARAIGEALGLDYCGVDFSVLPDGRLLVFEANATMLAHDEDPCGPFAYKNPYVAEIADAFQAHLARLAGR